MASIYSRQKNNEGKWRYVRVNTGRGRRPNDLAGPYYLRVTIDGRSQWLPAGDTLGNARQEADKREATLEAQASGLAVEDETNHRLIAKVEAFNAETKANKAHKTALAYANTLRYFTASCHKTYVEGITREDLLAFKAHLRSENLSDRSVYNNFLNTMVFLKWCGVKTGVKKDDWPKKPEREPEEYTDEEINKILKAADAEERLLLKCFLSSGLRSGEMAHLTYGDIDFKHSVWTVQPKKGWTTKTGSSQRDVPVPEWLTAMVQNRMEANGRAKADLIFFNGHGGPDLHMLRIVKRVAKRAKVTGRVDDHKFRSTAITRWLREGNGMIDVMSWVGHTSLETIQRYAAKVRVRQAETRKKAEGAFACNSREHDSSLLFSSRTVCRPNVPAI